MRETCTTRPITCGNKSQQLQQVWDRELGEHKGSRQSTHQLFGLVTVQPRLRSYQADSRRLAEPRYQRYRPMVSPERNPPTGSYVGEEARKALSKFTNTSGDQATTSPPPSAAADPIAVPRAIACARRTADCHDLKHNQ